jgi:hypothetical protein
MTKPNTARVTPIDLVAIQLAFSLSTQESLWQTLQIT